MNFFSREAVHYWNLAEEQEAKADQIADELKARHGTVISHPTRDTALGMQRHYLRKAQAAATIAIALGQPLTGRQD